MRASDAEFPPSLLVGLVDEVLHVRHVKELELSVGQRPKPADVVGVDVADERGREGFRRSVSIDKPTPPAADSSKKSSRSESVRPAWGLSQRATNKTNEALDLASEIVLDLVEDQSVPKPVLEIAPRQVVKLRADCAFRERLLPVPQLRQPGLNELVESGKNAGHADEKGRLENVQVFSDL